MTYQINKKIFKSLKQALNYQQELMQKNQQSSSSLIDCLLIRDKYETSIEVK